MTLQQGRRNPKFYTEFLKKYVSHICGRTKWNLMVRNTKNIPKENYTSEQYNNVITKEKSWTISDEAFALTIFKNNTDVWKEELTKRLSVMRRNGGEDETTVTSHKPKPLFTRSKRISDRNDTDNDDTTHQTNTTKSHHSWTEEGIKYYNSMIAKVKRDKGEHPNFDTDLIKTMIDMKNTKKRKRNANVEGVLAEICLDS